MHSVQFDVNNTPFRQQFDREILIRVITGLTPDSQGSWGLMKPQQMVEHLDWTYRLSTGREQVECKVPPGDREWMKNFLYTAVTTPLNFSNPALVSGLPRLKHGSPADAIAALREEIEFFWNRPAHTVNELRTHPLFGPIDAE